MTEELSSEELSTKKSRIKYTLRLFGVVLLAMVICTLILYFYLFFSMLEPGEPGCLSLSFKVLGYEVDLPSLLCKSRS